MDFLSMLASVPSVMANFSGATTDPYRKQKKQVMDALVNETNPLYQKLYGQYRKENLSGLSEGISEAERQNRLASRLGRAPLFEQERAGESPFRALMQGYQTAGTRAGEQTRGSLQQMLGNYTGMTPQTAAGSASKLLGYENIANIIGGRQLSKPQDQSGDYLKKILEALSGNKQNPLSGNW